MRRSPSNPAHPTACCLHCAKALVTYSQTLRPTRNVYCTLKQSFVHYAHFCRAGYRRRRTDIQPRLGLHVARVGRPWEP